MFLDLFPPFFLYRAGETVKVKLSYQLTEQTNTQALGRWLANQIAGFVSL